MPLPRADRLRAVLPVAAGVLGALGLAAERVHAPVWAELLAPAAESLWALTLVVSLMRFWYDGFV